MELAAVAGSSCWDFTTVKSYNCSVQRERPRCGRQEMSGATQLNPPASKFPTPWGPKEARRNFSNKNRAFVGSRVQGDRMLKGHVFHAILCSPGFFSSGRYVPPKIHIQTRVRAVRGGRRWETGVVGSKRVSEARWRLSRDWGRWRAFFFFNF